MPNQQPAITDVSGKRSFVCSPAAVLGCIVNAEEKILLLSHPRRKGYWEVVNGALACMSSKVVVDLPRVTP